MADIELVIKIPEEIYQHYKKVWQKRRGSIPESCIAFGTPLPRSRKMNKDEYRAEVLKELREIRLNTEVTSIFSILAAALLFIISIIVLFK